MIIRTGFAGLGQVIANLNTGAVDLTNCDPTTMSAFNQGLISAPVCAAPISSGSNSSTPEMSQTMIWTIAAVALLVVVLAVRR